MVMIRDRNVLSLSTLRRNVMEAEPFFFSCVNKPGNPLSTQMRHFQLSSRVRVRVSAEH